MILPFSTSISAATASIRSPTSLKNEDSRSCLSPATEWIGFQPCFAGARYCRNQYRSKGSEPQLAPCLNYPERLATTERDLPPAGSRQRFDQHLGCRGNFGG